MGIIQELFDTQGKAYELAGSKTSDDSNPISIKLSDKKNEVERVEPVELEQVYYSDPISFNSINKSTQMIMAAGYEFRGENADYFEEFFKNIGKVGDNLTFDELLEGIFRNQMIYGNAYVELVNGKKTGDIVDITLIDSKNMDLARNTDGKVVTDNYGRPVGYVQKVPYGYNTDGKGDKVPPEVNLNNGIFLKAERICQFKLYAIGDRFSGVGLIEPAYKSIYRRLSIEEAQTNSIYTKGTFPVLASVGDELHHPTPSMTNDTLKMLRNLKHDRYLAHPYYVKPYPLEVKQPDIVDQSLIYLRKNITASLGVPEAFAVGSGEATNRATLNNQQRFLEFTLRDIIKRTISTFQKYVSSKIAEVNLKTEKYPELHFGDVGVEEINDKSKRLVSYVEKGILFPEDIRSYAIKSEGLEAGEKGESKEEKKEEPKEEKKEKGGKEDAE